VLQAHVPLSSSILWRMQARYYEEAGAGAWESGTVPSWVGANAASAAAYAAAAIAAWRDLAARGALVAGQPLRVLEVGAGSGKFGYLLARALAERAPCLAVPPLGSPPPRIVVILTDASAANVAAWAANPALAALAAAGLVDFAHLAAGGIDGGGSVTLQVSGEVLTPDVLARGNPLLLVANYLLDSLPSDVYRVVQWEADDAGVARALLQAGLLSVGSARATEPDPTHPDVLRRLDNDWLFADVAAGSLVPAALPRETGDEDVATALGAAVVGSAAAGTSGVAAVLAWYAARGCEADVEEAHPSAMGTWDGSDLFVPSPAAAPVAAAAAIIDDLLAPPPPCRWRRHPSTTPIAPPSGVCRTATFPLPVGALRLLEWAAALTGDAGFLLLAGDKGYAHPAAFVGAPPPTLALHGSFSTMVNFHALAVAVRAAGGDVLLSPYDDVAFKVAALAILPRLVISGAPPLRLATALPLFADTFMDRLVARGPGDALALRSFFARAASATRPPPAARHLADLHPPLPPVTRSRHGRPPTATRTRRVGAWVVSSSDDDDDDGGSDSSDDDSSSDGDGGSSDSSSNHSGGGGTSTSNSDSDNGGQYGLSLRAVVALLQALEWDGDAVAALRDDVAGRLRRCTPPRRAVLEAGLLRSLATWFPAPKPAVEDVEGGVPPPAAPVDVAFEVGRILQVAGGAGRGELPSALVAGAQRAYMASLGATGWCTPVAANLAATCVARGQRRLAAAWLQRAADAGGVDTDMLLHWAAALRASGGGPGGGGGGGGGGGSAGVGGGGDAAADSAHLHGDDASAAATTSAPTSVPSGASLSALREVAPDGSARLLLGRRR